MINYMTKMTFNEIINSTEHFTAQHAKYRILYCIHHLYIQKKIFSIFLAFYILNSD